MPRYEHDPSAVTAALTTFPKDDYEFEIGRPKAFERTAAKGHQSYGIRFPVTVMEGPQKGKKGVYTVYLHSEGAAAMGKRFQMAVAGFNVNEKEEKEFDAGAAGQDWGYDTTDGVVGAAWAEYNGKRVMCSCDIQFAKNPDGTPLLDEKTGEQVQQQVWNWFPMVQAPA